MEMPVDSTTDRHPDMDEEQLKALLPCNYKADAS